MKIFQNIYYKEHCFALDAESVLDKAVDLDHIGGTYGPNKDPTPFLCLIMKLLQIQPSKDIIEEYITNDDFKYLRALGLFYIRLIETPDNVYKKLEPYLVDNRKLVCLNEPSFGEGEVFSKYKIMHMDEFIDLILREEIVFGVTLPHLPKRFLLEDQGVLARYRSPLEDEYLELYGEEVKEEQEEKEDDIEEQNQPKSKLKERRDKKSSSSDESDDGKKERVKDTESIEYWNELRAKQGLRPLKAPDSTKTDSMQVKEKKHRKKSSESDKSDKKEGAKLKEDSIEYWNEIRSKLGLKPLKEANKDDELPAIQALNKTKDDYNKSGMKDEKGKLKFKSDSTSKNQQNKGDKEFGVDYWNNIRSKMGLKNLKEKGDNK